jgi:hypothetical protein
MSMFHPRTVKCGCGATFVANLADTVNVRRTPDLRGQILAGSFHRVTCPTCQRQVTVEKDFFYIDPDRNTFIQVKPVADRHRWQEASVALDHSVQYKVPAAVYPSEGRTLRVAFGLEELREKLVAQDADLDDRLAELAKVLVVYEHPFLLQRARLRLLLTNVTAENVHFVACYDHAPNRYRIDLPREIADGIVARREEMERWVSDQHVRSNLFALGNDHWVNLWRWSPQTWALSSLHEYATTIGQGQTVDHESPQYRSMVKYLPRGSTFPAGRSRTSRRSSGTPKPATWGSSRTRSSRSASTSRWRTTGP